MPPALLLATAPQAATPMHCTSPDRSWLIRRADRGTDGPSSQASVSPDGSWQIRIPVRLRRPPGQATAAITRLIRAVDDPMLRTVVPGRARDHFSVNDV